MDNLIPIFSLVVAFFAVFVGPLISLRIARRQVLSSLEVANKQILGPMRQAWINSLRDLFAELASSALHYAVAGYEDRTDEEYRRLTLLEHKIQLMLNPNEDDHKTLELQVRKMVGALNRGHEADQDFRDAYGTIMKFSREVFKREWDRVRQPIKLA
jgi:hypothetical protein